MRNAVRRVLPIAAHPPQLSLGQGIKETEDIRSKGGQRCRCCSGTSKGQSRIDHLPHFLQGNEASLEEPFDQAIAREPERSKWADCLQTEQATPVRK